MSALPHRAAARRSAAQSPARPAFIGERDQLLGHAALNQMTAPSSVVPPPAQITNGGYQVTFEVRGLHTNNLFPFSMLGWRGFTPIFAGLGLLLALSGPPLS